MARPSPLFQIPTYDPNRLMDALLHKHQLKNDAALARYLQITPALVCKIRYRRLPVSNGFMVLLHDRLGMSLDETRQLMGAPRQRLVAAGEAGA